MTADKINIAILISGRGSNMMSLIEASRDPAFPARIVGVISNRPDAPGLAHAADAGLPTQTIDHKTFPSREAFEAALHNALGAWPVDLICLAGFMRVLGPGFVDKWPGRILNIHPSLLPAYRGLHTHERAIADGARESGCTVHIVTPDLDDGPIIVQRRVDVAAGDTPGTLAARILTEEHRAYPDAIRALIAQGFQAKE